MIFGFFCLTSRPVGHDDFQSNETSIHSQASFDRSTKDSRVDIATRENRDDSEGNSMMREREKESNFKQLVLFALQLRYFATDDCCQADCTTAFDDCLNLLG